MMNQYGQKPMNPNPEMNSGMAQLQSALENKPFTVDEIQMKQRQDQQQQQGGKVGMKDIMQMASSWGN